MPWKFRIENRARTFYIIWRCYHCDKSQDMKQIMWEVYAKQDKEYFHNSNIGVHEYKFCDNCFRINPGIIEDSSQLPFHGYQWGTNRKTKNGI